MVHRADGYRGRVYLRGSRWVAQVLQQGRNHTRTLATGRGFATRQRALDWVIDELDAAVVVRGVRS